MKVINAMAKMTKVNNGVPEISSKEFDKFILGDEVVVVDFFADWCMPCLMMAPVFEELAEKYTGKITFAKVNIDDNSSLSSKHKVMSIPTTIVFKKGKEVGRFVGAMQPEDLENKINSLVK